jgi:flagellar hook assembly protein FlgD
LVFPNPFSKSVVIEYFLEESAAVTLTIFNHLGQEIEMPVNEQQAKGKYVVTWYGENLPDGIYYCRLQAGEQIKTMKIVKMKL